MLDTLVCEVLDHSQVNRAFYRLVRLWIILIDIRPKLSWY